MCVTLLLSLKVFHFSPSPNAASGPACEPPAGFREDGTLLCPSQPASGALAGPQEPLQVPPRRPGGAADTEPHARGGRHRGVLGLGTQPGGGRGSRCWWMGRTGRPGGSGARPSPLLSHLSSQRASSSLRTDECPALGTSPGNKVALINNGFIELQVHMRIIWGLLRNTRPHLQ